MTALVTATRLAGIRLYSQPQLKPHLGEYMAILLGVIGVFVFILIIFGLELFAVVLFTSNTANILAWGIFGSPFQIAKDFGTLIVY